MSDLPHGWIWATIAELSEPLAYGWTASATQQDSGFKLLRTTDLRGGIDWGSVPYASEVPEKPERYLVRHGDLFISRAGSIGVSAAVANPPLGVVFASYLIRIRPLADGLTQWMRYFFQTASYWEQIREHQTGIALLNVNASKLSSIRMPLPSPAEQSRIIAELDRHFTRIDESVAGLQQVTRKIQTLIRSTLRQLSSDAAPWPQKAIGDIAECLDGKRVPVNREERAKRPGNIPYYGANGRVGWIDVAVFNEPLVLVVEDETFIGRQIPFSYMIEGPAWVNNHAHVLKARPGISSKYLSYALNYYPFTPLTTGSTGRRKLTKRALMSAEIAVPPYALQAETVDRIETLLTEAERQRGSLSDSIKRANSLRKAILAKAFLGQLAPQNANGESASEFLKRIHGTRQTCQKIVQARRARAQRQKTAQA